MIVFKNIKLCNFMSFGLLDFKLDRKGINLILGENYDTISGGSNGSGKSALCESVYYALFGKTLRGGSGADVIRYGQKECVVELSFSIVDGVNVNNYEVIRIRNKSGGSLILKENGEDISLRDMRETQKIINGLFDEDIVKNSIIFSGSVFVPFVSLGDVDKKRIVSTLFGFDKIEQAREIVKTKLKSLDKDLQVAVNMHDTYVSELEQLKASYDNLVAEFEMKNIDGEISELERSMDKYTKKIKFLNEKYSDLVNENASLQRIIDDIRQKISEVDVDIEKNKTARDKERNLMNEKIELLKVGKCPKCGQVVKRGGVVDEELRRVEAIVNDYDVILSELSKKKEMLIGELNQIVGKMTDISMLNSLRVECNNYEKQLRDIERRLKELIEKKSTYEAYKKKMHESIEDMKTKIDELIKKIEKLKREKYYYDFWDEGFSSQGIISYLLDICFPFFNKKLNEYLQVLFSGVTARFVPFTVLKSGAIKEKWNFEVSGLGDYMNCSSGEKRRIDIAILFAFNSLVRKMLGGTNILFIDEGLSYLDDVGVLSVLNLLKVIDIDCIYIAVQNDDVITRYIDPTSIIKVVKKGGVSVISD